MSRVITPGMGNLSAAEIAAIQNADNQVMSQQLMIQDLLMSTAKGVLFQLVTDNNTEDDESINHLINKSTRVAIKFAKRFGLDVKIPAPELKEDTGEATGKGYVEQ